MVDPYRNELLDASFEAIRLELENTQKDLTKLEERAEKLRAAKGALSELVSASGDRMPSFLSKSTTARGLEGSPQKDPHMPSEAARATA